VKNDVPTWNYLTVQARGQASLVADPEGLVRILRETTDHMNRIYEDKWEFSLPTPEDAPERSSRAIVGFTLNPVSIEGKFKLSQNRSAGDREAVIRRLAERDDEGSRRVSDWMRRLES
jgi:transcriptional regulator